MIDALVIVLGGCLGFVIFAAGYSAIARWNDARMFRWLREQRELDDESRRDV